MVLGWDIGGVNTKLAAVDAGRVIAVREAPFELQRAPRTLSFLLRRLAADVVGAADVVHAVTMTAELSQMFRTKRDGVCFVLDALEEAFAGAPIRVFTVGGSFITPAHARERALEVGAANWMATAMAVSTHHPDAVLVDIGTTTTDIVPIVAGRVRATGVTDLDRLGTGELLYTGVVRTPVEAVVRHVNARGARVAVSAEGFALTGDVHVWRGDLAEAEYDAPTPDGRPATREFAGERLRRVVCADRDMLCDDEVSAIAACVAQRQIEQVAEAIRSVVRAHPALACAVVTGRGAFLAAAAAREAQLGVRWLSSDLGADAARSAPAVAVALLCARARDAVRQRASEADGGGTATVRAQLPANPSGAALVDVVVKVGGGTLQSPADLDTALAVLDGCADRRVLIVPGGGPFADAVRETDRRIGLSDEAAHWMAIRGMDVFAELLVSRLARGVLVQSPGDIRTALEGGRLPVLAPSRWLRVEDPLPHSWDVTSDSIAAWLAAVIRARQLILLKPRGSQGAELTDAFFSRASAPGVRTTLLSVDRAGELPSLLGAVSAG